MKVVLQPAAGAKITVKTKDGKTLDNNTIDSVTFEPFFSMVKGQGDIANGIIVSATDVEVDKFVLQASGNNGKLSRRDRIDEGVIPLIDRRRPPAKPAETGKS